MSLLGAVAITTALGVLLGALAARRAVQPLADAAQAAQAIAGGGLDTRLEPGDDPDLQVLAGSFNDMAPRCRSGSSATPGSRPTSATSCGRRS